MSNDSLTWERVFADNDYDTLRSRANTLHRAVIQPNFVYKQVVCSCGLGADAGGTPICRVLITLEQLRPLPCTPAAAELAKQALACVDLMLQLEESRP
jgi:hypothetical protein